MKMLRSKLLVGLFLLVLLVGSASAVVVDCGLDRWYNVVSKHCEASELQPVFDELEDEVNALGDYVSDNEVDYLKDSGVSLGRVKKHLATDFLPFLKGLFASRAEVDVLEARVVSLEREVSGLTTMVHFMSLGYTDIHYLGCCVLVGRGSNGVLVALR